MRRTVRFNNTPRRASEQISLMAEQGVDTRNLPQLLDTKRAQVIKNWNVDAAGQLIKRQGFKSVHKIASITGFSLLEHYYNDVFIVGYGTTISAVDVVANTEIVIKSNFSEFSPVSGKVYGNYFFLGTGGTEKIARVSLTLAYDSQTVNFTVGDRITGGTSDATATILEDADGGATGTLTIGNIDGTFINGEPLTDEGSGDGNVDGVLTYVFTEISAAPAMKIVEISSTGTSTDARLLSGNERSDPTLFQSSDVDDGTNPPFDTWTVGTVPGNGFNIFNKGVGELNTISSLGSQIIVGYQTGRLGFRIQVIGDSASPRQDTSIDFENKQEGMLSNAIEASIGVIFVTDSGFKALISGGQTNVPFSEQILDISFNLDPDYFSDVDFSNVSIIEDVKRNLILFSFRKDSDNNNIVWAYNTELKNLVEYSLNIDSFSKNGNVIYGVSSLDGNVYEMFTGSDDNGIPIQTDYQQELRLSSLDGRHDLQGFIIQGVIGESSTHLVRFNVFDNNGVLTEDKAVHKIEGQTPLALMTGWGTASFGSSGFGVGDQPSQLEPRPYQNRDVGLKDFWRISIRLTSNDILPAKINFFSATIVDRSEKLLLNNLPINT